MVLEIHNASFCGNELQICETQLHALNEYSAPMPWIGMYIAAASLLCTILMVADLVYAYRWRKYWFPSKYFTLNAATLTLLGVVVKLSLDISSPMPRDIDRFAKQSNTMLMITIMANFSTSLASMDGKSLISNLIALVILVVTVCVNLIIQMNTGLVSDDLVSTVYLPIILSVAMLGMIVGNGLCYQCVKVSGEGYYQLQYEMILNEERLREGRLTTSRLDLVIKKLWILAVTCNPQIVLANFIWIFHFVALLANIALPQFGITTVFGSKFSHKVDGAVFSSSDYSWSIIWISKIQAIGCFIGSIGFILRLITLIFKLNSKPMNTVKILSSGFFAPRIPLQFQVPISKCRKLLSCIFQNVAIFIPVVMFVNVMVTCSVFILSLLGHAISFFYFYIVKLKKYISVNGTDNSSVQREQESNLDVELAHLAGFAFCLYDWQNRLSNIELNMIYYEQHHLIQTGKRQQPMNLFQLLQRSNSFVGVNDFDHIQVSRLHTKEPPTCWTLPVMTLARIAIALPQENNESFENIIKSVTEGLKYADLVDQFFEANQELLNIRIAVKVMWLDVELDHKWLNVKPIMRTSRDAKFSKEILQGLAGTAKNIVGKFKKRKGDNIFWPNEVVAAYSMYRISSTLLLAYDEEGNAQATAAADDGLLEKIINMIADILSACLTNLPYVMTQECNCNTIEKLEDRARHVSLLFGECEEILKLLESRKVPLVDPEKALHIDEWQAFFSQGNAYSSPPIPNNVNSSRSPEEEHVANAALSPEEVHMSTEIKSA